MNAFIDGVRLLDEVEGEGTAERWTNMCAANGGIVLCTPWLYFIGFPKRGDERCLYVSYLYGTGKAVADFSVYILDTGLFDRVEFRKNFLKGDSAEGPFMYDGKFVRRLARILSRKEEV